MTVRVLVVEDQPIVREGVVLLVGSQPDLTVVGEAADGDEGADLALELRPDVVVMDVRMPRVDGLEATRRILAGLPDPAATKILMLTTFHDDATVHGALLAGASGYLLKEAAPQDLFRAIRCVADGDAWLDPAVAGHVIAALAKVVRVSEDVPAQLARLTPREREVLALMAQGQSNAEIAATLVIGEGTVKTHVCRTLMKTASRDRPQAIALAYRSGLVVPPAVP